MVDVNSYERWLQWLGAVSWLSRVKRPGLTPTEALEEALRYWLAGVSDPEFGATPPPTPASEVDPLGATLGVWLDNRDQRDSLPAAAVLEEAIGSWCELMADRYNDGELWPHPPPSAGWPTPTISS